jgi:hypothetical protein
MNPDSISSPTTINLSCANCNTIRPFSGGPPNWKCEVCGWELGTSNRTPVPNKGSQAQSKKRKKAIRIVGDIFDALGALFKGLVVLMLIGGVAVVIVEYFKSDQDKIAEQYHVSSLIVTVEPKPYGCGYNDAPLGDKHCHFEKVVDVDRECAQPNCKIRAVYVSWRKVSE